jgi:hypothetical protein
MMNAAISGTKGFALLVDGGVVDVIDLHCHRRPARADQVRRMLDEVGDAVFVECEDLDDARRKLGEAANAANALHLSLIMLDSLLSRETRRAACDELAERFEFDHAVEYVERVLYARPLGPEHDLPGARDLASAQTVCEFLDRLRSIQPAANPQS